MTNKVQRRGSVRGTRRQPEESRRVILSAALAEFAEQGLAGARIDAIAAAAGVNKALLYYYFRSKDELYTAVLEDFFQRLHVRVNAALDTDAAAGERILLYARAHFDSIAESPYYARLFQGEMMNAGRDASEHLSHIVDEHIGPLTKRVAMVLEKGIKRHEFRAVDPMQFAPTMAASIVHYFVVSPVIRKLRNIDPFSPEAVAQRRMAVLDFIAAALFLDREAGVKLASDIAKRPIQLAGQGPANATTALKGNERGRQS